MSTAIATTTTVRTSVCKISFGTVPTALLQNVGGRGYLPSLTLHERTMTQLNWT